MKAADANGRELAMGDVVRCVDPGRELGLEAGKEYDVVRVLDRWTVAVQSRERASIWYVQKVDGQMRAELPGRETLSPRMAGRFAKVTA